MIWERAYMQMALVKSDMYGTKKFNDSISHQLIQEMNNLIDQHIIFNDYQLIDSRQFNIVKAEAFTYQKEYDTAIYYFLELFEDQELIDSLIIIRPLDYLENEALYGICGILLQKEDYEKALFYVKYLVKNDKKWGNDYLIYSQKSTRQYLSIIKAGKLTKEIKLFYLEKSLGCFTIYVGDNINRPLEPNNIYLRHGYFFIDQLNNYLSKIEETNDLDELIILTKQNSSTKNIIEMIKELTEIISILSD